MSAGTLARGLGGVGGVADPCSEAALLERIDLGIGDDGLGFAGNPQTQLLLEQLRSGCGLDGVPLTPELAGVVAAQAAPAGTGATAGRLGAQAGRTTTTDRLADQRAAERRADATADTTAARPTGAGLTDPRLGTNTRRTVGSAPAFDGMRAALGQPGVSGAR